MAETRKAKQVQTLRDKLKNGERGGSDRDRNILLEFSDRLKLLRDEYGHARHEKLLRTCCRMSEHAPVDLAETLENREATEEVVRWIHDNYDLDETPETNTDYRIILRVFGKRATEDGVDGPESPPESIEWVSATLPNDYDPSPDPTDMLTWEDDIQPMLDAAKNPRDKAAIAMQFDAGFRGGELQALTPGAITSTDIGLSVSVDGKQGQRSVDLIPSTPHVSEWLAKHPGDNNDPLWCKLSKPDELSYRAYLNMFSEVADRAGVEKKVTPTTLRKSNLAWLAKQGMNARYIEQRQGRVAGSDAVARYVGIFDSDIGNEYARMMGIEVEDDDKDQELAPLVCPRCDRETPRDKDRCVWCGQAMKVNTSEKDKNIRLEIADVLAQTDGDDATAVMQLMELIEEYPQLRGFVDD